MLNGTETIDIVVAITAIIGVVVAIISAIATIIGVRSSKKKEQVSTEQTQTQSQSQSQVQNQTQNQTKSQNQNQSQTQTQSQKQDIDINVNVNLTPTPTPPTHDNISYHVTNAPITTSPPRPNNKFTHREKELYQLREKITQTQKLALINGLGGVGKTTIAKALFHQLKEEAKYTHIAWIEYQANIKESLLKAFTLFTDINDSDTRYAEIQKFITTAGKDIIIFIDNVSENANDLGFLETLDATVILTSRRKKIGNFEPFPIGFLDEPQCIDIFYKYYDHDKNRKHENIVKTLVSYVKCHTLSVELLAGVANAAKDTRRDYTLAQLVQDLKEKGFGDFDLDVETDYTGQSTTIAEHLRAVFALSDEKFSDPERLPEQRRILKNFAILPSVVIPHDIKDWINCREKDLQWLISRNWLTASADGCEMHPIIKESITLQYDKPSYDDCAEIIDYMKGKEYIKLTDHYTISHFRLSLAEAVMEQFCDEERREICSLLYNIATNNQNYGDYDKALHWFEKERKIKEKIYGTDHPNTAATYNNIANVYNLQGKYDEALHWYEKSIEINEKFHGTDHPNTATTYNNIGQVYYSQGKYDEALLWLEKVRKINEKALGTDHPHTATTYNNIAGVYKTQGKYDEALLWLEKVRKIDEKTNGTDHPDTATIYNNIAIVYRNQGNYDEALPLYIKAYRICLEKLGETHPHTKTAKENMRKLYTALHGNSPSFDHWLSTHL